MQSPFAEKLHTNYVPSAQEAATIRQAIVPHLLELQDIDQQIRVLSARREALSAYVDPHTALLFSSRRLPRSVLEIIFQACLPRHTNAAVDITEAPLLLTQVNSAWRAIALSTPQLWASLHVPLPFFVGLVDRTDLLREWLERSGTCPISLSIRGSRNGPKSWIALRLGPDLRQTTVHWQILAQHAQRVRRLQIVQASPTEVKAILAAEMPLLESFELEEYRDSNEVETFDMIAGTSLVAQNLTTLSLPNFSSNHTDPLRILPTNLEALTHLNLGYDISTSTSMNRKTSGTMGLSLPDALEILMKCPQLEDFRWSPRRASATSTHNWAKVLEALHRRTLPRLHRLLSSEGNDDTIDEVDRSSFWSHLPPAPDIECLSISRSLTPTMDPVTEIENFLRRMPALRSLALPLPPNLNLNPQWRGDVGTALRRILVVVPNLVSLELTDEPFPNTIYTLLRILTPTPADATDSASTNNRLCPNLTHLRIALCNVAPPPALLTGFLSRHVEQQTPFRCFQMNIYRVGPNPRRPLVSPDLLERSRAAGLQVQITFGDSWSAERDGGTAVSGRQNLPFTLSEW